MALKFCSELWRISLKRWRMRSSTLTQPDHRAVYSWTSSASLEIFLPWMLHNLLGHSAAGCCHLCTFYRRWSTIVSCRFASIIFHGSATAYRRTYYQHTSVRGCCAKEETCCCLESILAPRNTGCQAISCYIACVSKFGEQKKRFRYFRRTSSCPLCLLSLQSMLQRTSLQDILKIAWI